MTIIWIFPLAAAALLLWHIRIISNQPAKDTKVRQIDRIKPIKEFYDQETNIRFP